MKPADFDHWLSDRRRATMIVYHRGFLALDRSRDRDLAQLARLALEASGAEVVRTETRSGRVLAPAGPERVILTQRRLGPSCYEYRATRSPVAGFGR